MRARVAAVLLLAACGPQAHEAAPAAGGPPPFDPADLARAVNQPTQADREARDWPSLASRSDGDVWLAAVDWDGATDGLAVGPISRVEGEPRRVHASSARILFTASAADAQDALHVLFCEQTESGWALRELFAPNGPDGLPDLSRAPRTLREAPGRACVEPVLAADPEGRLLAAWVEVGEGLSLWAAAWGPRGWSAPVEVSHQRESNWAPSACATGPGAFALAWDAAVDGDYDVQLARLELDAAGAPRVTSRQRVTDSPRGEMHASITAHGERLYVAYDVSPERWGREGSVNRLDQALHATRTLEVVAVEGGQVAPLALQPVAGLNEALAANCELPELMAEGTGSLLLLFRGLPLPPAFDDPDSEGFQDRSQRHAAGKGWRTSIWVTYMTRLDGAAWDVDGNHHMGVPGSTGRADAPAAVTRRPAGGIALAITGDGRNAEAFVETPAVADAPATPAAAAPGAFDMNKSWWSPVTASATRTGWHLMKRQPLAQPIALGPARALPAPREPAPRPAPPTRAGPDGAPLRLALGDLHRHTDISRCSSNWDGPLGDALRYAYDVAPLDFLAITDHFDHMTKYDWWRTLAFVDAWDCAGRMATLRAYERTDMATGHRNVLSRDGGPPLVGYRYGYDPARDDGRADTPAELWPLLAGGQVLTIPHTPAGMLPTKPEVLDWSTFNPAFDRVVEVFQSYRGSSEAEDAPRAIPGLHPARYVLPNLDLGLHFGLIASSDHQSSYGAFAGAWVGEGTRAGVFDALFARRTFGSTVRASLWAEWAGVPMGQAAALTAGEAEFMVEVDAFGRALERVEVIRDGEVAVEQRIEDGRSVARVVLPLPLPEQGSSYAYARVTCADGELMWSSPVRLFAPGAWPGPDGPDGAEVKERAGDVWGLDTDPLRERMRARGDGR
jgi:hypothetical protein